MNSCLDMTIERPHVPCSRYFALEQHAKEGRESLEWKRILYLKAIQHAIRSFAARVAKPISEVNLKIEIDDVRSGDRSVLTLCLKRIKHHRSPLMREIGTRILLTPCS